MYIINYLRPKYFYIENPRGVLRKLGLIPDEYLKTAWYCQYGDTRAKPTDIWTNNSSWIPKRCRNNLHPEQITLFKECGHEVAPRGSKTGTQGLKNAYERSKVPEDLCNEILTTHKDLYD